MTNNEILFQMRDVLALDDETLVRVFAHCDTEVSTAELDQWFEGGEFEDVKMAAFLNGLIIEKRGKKDGDQPALETTLTNNLVFRKLMIALNLKADDVLEILEEAGWKLGKRELGAYFRAPGNTHYRVCKDEVLAGFLNGLELLLKKQ